jgi:hypothetical protein
MTHVAYVNGNLKLSVSTDDERATALEFRDVASLYTDFDNKCPLLCTNVQEFPKLAPKFDIRNFSPYDFSYLVDHMQGLQDTLPFDDRHAACSSFLNRLHYRFYITASDLPQSKHVHLGDNANMYSTNPTSMVVDSMQTLAPFPITVNGYTWAKNRDLCLENIKSKIESRTSAEVTTDAILNVFTDALRNIVVKRRSRPGLVVIDTSTFVSVESDNDKIDVFNQLKTYEISMRSNKITFTEATEQKRESLKNNFVYKKGDYNRFFGTYYKQSRESRGTVTDFVPLNGALYLHTLRNKSLKLTQDTTLYMSVRLNDTSRNRAKVYFFTVNEPYNESESFISLSQELWVSVKNQMAEFESRLNMVPRGQNEYTEIFALGHSKDGGGLYSRHKDLELRQALIRIELDEDDNPVYTSPQSPGRIAEFTAEPNALKRLSAKALAYERYKGITLGALGGIVGAYGLPLLAQLSFASIGW